MLRAGLRLLLREGVSLPVASVSLASVIEETAAPPASAYRAWRSEERKPQEEFHHRLAEALLSNVPGIGADFDSDDHSNQPVEDAVAEVLASAGGDVGEISSEERAVLFREVRRVGANADFASLLDSPSWMLFVATAASLSATATSHDDLHKAWREGETSLTERYLPLYQAMATIFGFRLRYCYTWEHFTLAASATTEGLAMRANVNNRANGVVRRTGPGGTDQVWSLFAVCFEALLRQFFEPDPESETQTTMTHE